MRQIIAVILSLLFSASSALADTCGCGYYSSSVKLPRGSQWKIQLDPGLGSLVTPIRNAIAAWRTESNWSSDLPKLGEDIVSNRVVKIRYGTRPTTGP
jgi:hypothetical protein